MNTKKGLIAAVVLIGIVMITVILLPKRSNKPISQPTSSDNWLNNPSITPESMRGEVKAKLDVPLKAQGSSAEAGKVTFTEVNGKVFVGVDLTNPTPGIEYPAYIYSGTCAGNDRPKYSLSPVIKGKTANYLTKTMVELKKEFPLSVRVLKSANDDSSYLVCADLQ